MKYQPASESRPRRNSPTQSVTSERARSSPLRHESGRADRSHRQYRAEARGGDARLLPRGLRARCLRHGEQGMDERPDPVIPGRFRRAHGRQSAPAAHAEVHAGRLPADRAPPAAAQASVTLCLMPYHCTLNANVQRPRVAAQVLVPFARLRSAVVSTHLRYLLLYNVRH